jgi:hypothetical protein
MFAIEPSRKGGLRLFFSSLLLVAIVCGSAGTLLAAGTTGTISGTVTNQATGSPVSGVTVQAVSPTSSQTAVTNAKGFYSFNGLTPDTFTVSFSGQGFQLFAVSGVTVNADQVNVVSPKLSKDLRTIGRVGARSTGGAYQPSQTQDTYTITPSQILTIQGRAGATSESNLITSLPGASYDSSGYPVLRGGRENEEGFQSEGIDQTDAFFSEFVNSLAVNPSLNTLQLTPGAGDSSSGNAGTGEINLTAKRGTYPAFGSIQGTLESRDYDHELAAEYGVASRSGALSNYIGYVGVRQDLSYGNETAANLIGRYFSPAGTIGDDLVDNLVYKFGRHQSQSLQLYGEIENYTFNNNYGGIGGLTFKPFDPFWISQAEGYTGLSAGQIQSILPRDPYQQAGAVALTRNPETYYQPNETYKLQYNDNISSSTYFNLKLYRVVSTSTFDFPYYDQNVFFSDFYNPQGGNRSGAQAEITQQLGTKNLAKLGGKYEFLHPVYDFDDYYDGLLSSGLFGNAGDFVPGGYLSTKGIGPTVDPYASEEATTNRQDYALYLTDTYTPSSRANIQGGIRFDGSNYRFASTDSSFYAPANIDAAGFPLNAAGKEVTSDTQAYVTNVPADAIHPLVVEPRLSASYELGDHDSIRASYGRSVELPPIGLVDLGGGRGQYRPFTGVPANAPNCGVTSNLTCRNYADQLYWQNQMELFGVPYEPIEPGTFNNFDFSYSHQFKSGVEAKITPFYRRGYNVSALVANPRTDANGNVVLNPDGTVVFGPPTATNLGVDRTTGIELLITKETAFGLTGQISGTYINETSNVIPGSVNEDFFPSIPSQSLALGNEYRVGFLSPVQLTAALQYKTKSGFRINPIVYFNEGYPIGQGLLTAAYVNGKAANVPNTNVTNSNGSSSATQYVDPENPGTLYNPNIVATRGTAEGNSAGGVLARPSVFANVMVEYSPPGSHSTVGVQVLNVFGNIYAGLGGGQNTLINTRYQPVATGISGPSSGYSALYAQYPSLGQAAYFDSLESGQSAYTIPPQFENRQVQLYYQLKL